MNPGSYKLTMEEYQSCPCPTPSLSRSTIINLLDCPRRAFADHAALNPKTGDEKAESKFDPGSAAHDLLFEGGKKIFVVEGFDDWRKKDAQEAREAARAAGMIPLLQKQYEVAAAMVEVAKTKIAKCQDFKVCNLEIQGDAELSYFWQEGDIWCQIRPDWISKDRKLIIDYKTSGTCVNPSIVSGHVSKMGYAIQHEFYRRGVQSVEGVKPDFVFLFQEDEPPFLCSWIGLDLQMADMAAQKVEWGINKWRECLATGQWDEYPDRICYCEPKPWDMAEWEMKRGGGME